MEADVAREADCRRIMDTAVANFGRLDILVNNAGIQSGTPTTELTEEEFDHVMAVNVKGVFFCCKYAIPYMKQIGGGSIVTTSSRTAFIPTNAAPIYCATKAAAASWTQAVALEHAADGIRANSIFPGIFATRTCRTVSSRQLRILWPGSSGSSRRSPSGGPAHLRIVPRPSCSSRRRKRRSSRMPDSWWMEDCASRRAMKRPKSIRLRTFGPRPVREGGSSLPCFESYAKPCGHPSSGSPLCAVQ